jgi:hypothetical protein
MDQFQLHFDNRIPQLEKENRWKSVVDIVLAQWTDSPNDLNRLVCAGTQLWYTLFVMDYIKNDPSPPNDIEYVPEMQLQKDLMRVTQYGFKYFADNAVFNAYFGYMISAMPYFFLVYDGDYLGWQTKGIEMLCYSYRLVPEHPFTKAMYHETTAGGKDTLFYSACKEIWSRITPNEWGKSEVQQYFFRILCGESFYSGAYSQNE